MKKNQFILQMKEYAEENHVPIMTDDGLQYLLQYIKKHHVKKILEIGTAIGYSAICMCGVSDDIEVTTIERDEPRYLEAVLNVEQAELEDRIHLIFQDALEVELDDMFDLIFIDAAKAQNIKFFERFEKNLKQGGTFITDNMDFHGMVQVDEDKIESRNVRQLVHKVKNYIAFLQENQNYDTQFLSIGDGLAVSVKK
jgi:predicted O-methyltransferase YrrM